MPCIRAERNYVGWSSYILIHIFLKFSNTSANNKVGCASSRYTIQRSTIQRCTIHVNISYANMPTLYRDKSWYQGGKYISIICKYLVSWVKKTSLTKKVETFKNCCLKFSVENNIAKLAVDMWRNCSNRLYQSTFSVFNTFSEFSISRIY